MTFVMVDKLVFNIKIPTEIQIYVPVKETSTETGKTSICIRRTVSFNKHYDFVVKRCTLFSLKRDW